MKTMAVLLSAAALVFGARSASAWHVSGVVLCDANGNGEIDAADTPLPGVTVQVIGQSVSYTASDVTDADGFYSVPLLEVPHTYVVTLDPATLPGDAVVLLPTTNPFEFATSESVAFPVIDWLVDSEVCREQGACWLTGGGVKFNPITNSHLAEKGPHHNFGGNVFPSCDPDPGQGGNWNHLAHSAKLHFQGTVITTVECGNVDGIPPGSTSPVTPFNFIEFQGTGVLKGFHGNKADYGTVFFFARAEDRNEPGSKGANDGELIDRYFLHVYAADGTTLLLVDVDGDPATVDPVTITGGNLQLHISSCDDPPI